VSYNNLTRVGYNANGNVSREFISNNWNNVIFEPISGQNANLNNTDINTASFTNEDFSINVIGGVIQNGVGTTQWTLDLSNPLVYNPITQSLTISFGFNTFFGVYQLENSVGFNISEIAQLSTRFTTRFYALNSLSTVNFITQNNKAIATPDQIIFATSPIIAISNNIVQDFIEIRKDNSGLLNVVEGFQIYT
jgi:hypothetical protein